MLTSQSPEVVEFLAACQENRNLAHSSGPSGYRVVVVERRKYLAVDEIPTFEGSDCPGQSGRFMIDREAGTVYTIRGYGQRGDRIGALAALTAHYREGSASYNPNARAHVETRRSHVASWSKPRPALYLVKLPMGS